MNTQAEITVQVSAWKIPESYGWTSHKFFNNQQDINLGHFTQEELDEVVTKIKIRKTAGHDEIPPEV